MIDNVLRPQMEEGAKRLRDTLNLWHGTTPTGEQAILAESVGALVGGISGLAGAIDEGLVVQKLIAEYTVAAARVGVGLVPFAGTALDFCEAISGRAWCIPGGEELSDEARLFSALGAGVSTAVFWRGAGGALTGGAGRLLAKNAEEMVETQVGKGLRLFRQTRWRGLHAATTEIEYINEFERQVASSIQSRGNTFFWFGRGCNRERAKGVAQRK